MVVEAGQIVRVRSRQYLVEDVTPELGQDTLVRLSCLEDDALGESLEVLLYKTYTNPDRAGY